MLRRFLTLGAGMLAAGSLLWWNSRRALISDASVSSCSSGHDGPPRASVVWIYSSGRRPINLVLDLHGPQDIHASLTTDGELQHAEIPLPARLQGRYTLTLTANYRVFGIASTEVRSFNKQL